MPSRNRSAKACELASLSPKETASLTDFSDIVYALTLRTRSCFLRQPLARRQPLRSGGPRVQHPDSKALDIVAARPRLASAGPGNGLVPERNREKRPNSK